MTEQEIGNYDWNWASQDHAVGDRSQDQPALVSVPGIEPNMPLVGLWTGDRMTNRQLFARLLAPISAKWLQQSSAVPGTDIIRGGGPGATCLWTGSASILYVFFVDSQGVPGWVSGAVSKTSGITWAAPEPVGVVTSAVGTPAVAVWGDTGRLMVVFRSAAGDLYGIMFDGEHATAPVQVASGANTDPALVYDEMTREVVCMFATGNDWRLVACSSRDGNSWTAWGDPIGDIVTTAAVAIISGPLFRLAVLFADCSGKPKVPLSSPARVVVATITGGWNDWVALPSKTQRGVSLASEFAQPAPNDFYWRAFALYRGSSNTDLFYAYTIR